MPIRSVTLRVLGNDRGARDALGWVRAESGRVSRLDPTIKVGADAHLADTTLRRTAQAADELGRKRPTITVGLSGNHAAGLGLDKLREKSDMLARKSAEIRVGLVGDRKSTLELDKLRLKIEHLGRMVAKPRVSLEGVHRAEVQIEDLDIKLDRLGHKRVTATVHVRTEGGGILSRLLGGGNPFGGGSAGGLSGMLGDSASGAGGGAPAGGAMPWLLGAGGALATALTPGVIGLGAGAVGAGATAGGSLFVSQHLNSEIPSLAKKIMADRKALDKAPTAQLRKSIALELRQAQDNLGFDRRLQPKFAQTAQTFGEMTDTMTRTVAKALAPVQKSLQGMMNSMAKSFTGLAPLLAHFFKASLPWISAFVKLLLQTARIILPSFTQAMQMMVKSGAMKLMMQGLLEIVKGLATFIKAMGPAFRPSAMVFLGVAKLLGGALNLLGRFIGFTVAHWKLMLVAIFPLTGIIIEIVTHLHTLAHVFDIVRHAVATFGHDVAHAFDVVRHAVASAWDHTWKWASDRFHAFAQFAGGLVHSFVNTVSHWFDTVRHWIAATWDHTWKWVSDRFRSFASFTIGVVRSFVNTVSHWFDNVRHWVASTWDHMWKWVSDRFRSFASFAVGLVHGFVNTVSHWFDQVRHWISATWDAMWHWVGNRAQVAFRFVVSLAKGFWHDVTHWFDTIRHDVASAWDAMWKWVGDRTSSAMHFLGGVLHRLEGIFRTPVAWVVDNVIDKLGSIWNWIDSHILGGSLPKFSGFHMSTGGIVPGTASMGDWVPVYATAGERILSLGQVDALGGHGAIDSMVGRSTSGGAGSHFARGGRISGPSPIANNATKLGNKGGKPGNFVFTGGKSPSGNPFMALWHGLQEIGHAIGAGASWLGKNALKGLENGVAGPAIHGLEGLLAHALPGGGWKGAVRGMGDKMLEGILTLLTSSIQKISGSGSQIAQWFVKTFRHTPYVWGGASTHGADCSGATALAYEKFGIWPGHGRHGTSESQFHDPTLRPSGAVPGALAFFAGSDGTQSNPGHVGIVLNHKMYASMYDTAEDFAIKPIQGSSGAVSGFRVPKKGFPGQGGPVGPGMVGIGRALMAEGFSRAAAAGIVGCIAGESGGNPESIGSGGGGLIGWTPLPHGFVTGNRQRDLRFQVAEIKRYVERNGSVGDMNRFRSPIGAADHFSEVYERPAVHLSDVRPGTATSVFARLAAGGILNEMVIGRGARTGMGYILAENGPELVSPLSRHSGPSGHVGGGGDTIVVKVTGKVGNETRTLMTQINDELRKRGKPALFS